MGLFNELIPSQKSAIMTFIEQQKTLAEVADELDREIQNSPYTPKALPLKSVYEIPRKKSWMEAIVQFQKETEQELSKFDEINEKIEQLHDMVETVDKINYFTDIPPEKKQEVEKKISQSSLAVKRVHQLGSGDSAVEVPKIPKATKKPIEVPKKFKSKFTASSSNLSKNSLSKNLSVTSLPAKASSSLISLPSKIHRTPPPRNVKVSESVRKLLDDVKEKRDKNNSQKKVPTNVINLRLN